MTFSILNEYREIINFFYPNRYFVWPKSLIGRLPEKYGITLFPEKDYDSLLERNKTLIDNNYFPPKKAEGINNFYIYSFEEIGGRKHEEIFNHTALKFNKMLKLQRYYSILIEASSKF